MDLLRIGKHLLAPQWWAVRHFGKPALMAVEAAIAASEQRHRGELRFVVEGALPPSHLFSGNSVRQRSIALFAQLGVWDTAENSGVLVYVQMLDHKVEIVADRGINERVGQVFWDAVCGRLETEFRAGRYEAGTLAALGEITEALVTHFPAGNINPNELPDRPLVL